jgi:hypothetical protein
MWALVKKNLLSYRKNPLDDRKKLVKISDLDKLRTVSQITDEGNLS